MDNIDDEKVSPEKIYEELMAQGLRISELEFHFARLDKRGDEFHERMIRFDERIDGIRSQQKAHYQELKRDTTDIKEMLEPFRIAFKTPADAARMFHDLNNSRHLHRIIRDNAIKAIITVLIGGALISLWHGMKILLAVQ